MKAKYINPFTDYGFKKIFGEEASKPQLLDFLNALLMLPSPIVDLQFKNTEHLGSTVIDRKAIFDIYCESQDGEKFIVELQKAKQNFFKDRSVYYATFPIQEQAEKGNWNYQLKAVYCIGILDFTFNDPQETPEQRQDVVHTVKLKNQHGKVFYDKLSFVYLEMPNFKKTEEALETRLDQWLYFLKHLEDFQEIPKLFDDPVFEQTLEKAELARFDRKEWDAYEQSLKVYRDMKGVLDTAFDEGMELGEMIGLERGLAEGVEIGKAEGVLLTQQTTALNLHALGLPLATIAAALSLSEAEVQQLLG